MSYVIPTNELTLTDIKEFKIRAINAGIARAIALGVARSEAELVVRHAFPLDDLGSATSGWVTNQYISNAIVAANAWGSAFSSGALPGTQHQLARTQVCVFYKFADTADVPVITAVRFRVGVSGATTKAAFYLQLETEAKLEPDVYLSEPVVYDPEDWLYIEVYPIGGVGVQETIPFGCFIVERTGGTIS